MLVDGIIIKAAPSRWYLVVGMDLLRIILDLIIKLIVSISVKESADCDYNCKPDGSCRVTYTGHLGRISRQGYTEVKMYLTLIFA